MEEDEYKDQIISAWKPIRSSANNTAMQKFAENLARAKKISKEWDKKHKNFSQKELKDVEKRIEVMFQKNERGVFSIEETTQLKSLESKRDSLLAKEEQIMRLKSRALWLEAGDKNTNFFHRSASHRKKINTIREIRNR